MSEIELLCTIGLGLGATVDQLLDLTSDDVTDGYISLYVGPLHIQRTYVLPKNIAESIQNRSGNIFTMAREEALIAVGTDDFLPLTMQRYYNETDDIFYPMHIMGIGQPEDIPWFIND